MQYFFLWQTHGLFRILRVFTRQNYTFLRFFASHFRRFSEQGSHVDGQVCDAIHYFEVVGVNDIRR